MDALDLTQRPPRSPRLLLGDVDLLFLARTVDKLRATLPGGNPGEYKIPGFSARLLKALGISEDALREEVARAASDDDVAQWVLQNTDPSKFEAINVAMEDRKVEHYLNDAEWVGRYPLAKTVPPDTKLIDFLILDDKQAFKDEKKPLSP